MHVASDVTETVGETPLLALDSFAPDLYGKVEAANPGGSVKDRIAVAMLERAREGGGRFGFFELLAGAPARLHFHFQAGF